MADEEPSPEEEPLVKDEPGTDEKAGADEAKDDSGKESAAEDEKPEKESWAVGEHDSCFHFPDFIFMIAWIMSVVIVFVCAMSYGISAVENLDDIIIEVEKNDDLVAGASYKLLYIPSIAFATSAVMCFVWLIVMILCGTCIMWSFFIGIFALCIAVAIYCFTIYPYVAYAFLAIAGLVAFWGWCIRGRINFAGKTLEIACHVISWYNSLILMSIVMLVLSGLYLALWVVGFIGLYVYMQYDSDDDDLTGGVFSELLVYFCFIVFFFWTAEVLKNIVVVSVAGVMANWWKNQEGEGAVVLQAFCRASTYNLGAIAMGSLIVAIIKALEAVCDYLAWVSMKAGQWWLTAIIEGIIFCLSCIQCCVEWITGYIYTYVGIYGHGFIGGGINVINLLATNLPTLAMNDGLVGTVIAIGSVIVGLASAAVSIVLVEDTDWADSYPGDDPAFSMASFGWAIGWMVSGVIFGLVLAGNKAVLVLWIEHPKSLQKTHEKYYNDLHHIWTQELGFKEAGDEDSEKGCCG